MPLLIFVLGLGVGLIAGAYLGGIRTFTISLDYQATNQSDWGDDRQAEGRAGDNTGDVVKSCRAADFSGKSSQLTGGADGNTEASGSATPHAPAYREPMAGGMPSPSPEAIPSSGVRVPR